MLRMTGRLRRKSADDRCSTRSMYKLEKVHKQALRVVLNDYTSSYRVKSRIYQCHVGSIKQTWWFKRRFSCWAAENEHYVLWSEYLYLSGCKIVEYITIAHPGSWFHIRVQITFIKMERTAMPLWLLWFMQYLQYLNGVILTFPYFTFSSFSNAVCIECLYGHFVLCDMCWFYGFYIDG